MLAEFFTEKNGIEKFKLYDTAIRIWFVYILDRLPKTIQYLSQGQPQKLCHIRLQDSAVTIGSTAILLDDSHPQAILKFYCLSNFKACHRLLVNL